MNKSLITNQCAVQKCFEQAGFYTPKSEEQKKKYEAVSKLIRSKKFWSSCKELLPLMEALY